MPVYTVVYITFIFVQQCCKQSTIFRASAWQQENHYRAGCIHKSPAQLHCVWMLLSTFGYSATCQPRCKVRQLYLTPFRQERQKSFHFDYGTAHFVLQFPTLNYITLLHISVWLVILHYLKWYYIKIYYVYINYECLHLAYNLVTVN